MTYYDYDYFVFDPGPTLFDAYSRFLVHVLACLLSFWFFSSWGISSLRGVFTIWLWIRGDV